jgi:hypothetical protein
MNELWRPRGGIKLLMKTVKIGLAADRRTLAFQYSVWHEGGGGRGQGVTPKRMPFLMAGMTQAKTTVVVKERPLRVLNYPYSHLCSWCVSLMILEGGRSFFVYMRV